MHVIERLQELARGNGGLVTTAAVKAAGISAQRLTDHVRDGRLARVARGVYAVAAAVDLPDPRALTIAWRVILSHESAAAWWGVDLPAAPGRVHVTAPRSRGRWRDAVRGVRLHRANLTADEVLVVRGVRVTSPLRTAVDLVRHDRPLAEAVAIVDSFLRAGLITVEEFEAAALRAQGPGARRLRQVAELIDPKCGSILESLTRVLLCLAGLGPEETQFPFKHPRTGWVGYLDFAWPSLRVALEADGYEFHAERGVFQSDRRRWSALNRADWRAGIVTWFDVTRDPDYVIALVRDLLTPVTLDRAS